MSALLIYREDHPETIERALFSEEEIAAAVAGAGVRFERWPAGRALQEGASQEQILAAYQEEIGRLNREGGYRAADVVRLARGTAGTAPMRAKFLSEHRHTEDEVRFFVEGSGTFYLHIEERVFALRCERNDLIRVPANTRHWFDMGEEPFFCAIRLFTAPEGWVGHFTGDPIAARFPSHDAVAALAAR